MGSRIGFIDLSISHLSVIFLQLGTQIENGVSIRESAVRYINYLWQFSLLLVLFLVPSRSLSLPSSLSLSLSFRISFLSASPHFWFFSVSFVLSWCQQYAKNQKYFRFNANFKYIYKRCRSLSNICHFEMKLHKIVLHLSL